MAGFLFFWHGLDKIFGVFGHGNPDEPELIRYTAGIIELICGPLIFLGLFTRVAAFISSGLMAGAYFIVVAPESLLPYMVPPGDIVVLYCFVFLYLSAKGDGIWSLGNS